MNSDPTLLYCVRLTNFTVLFIQLEVIIFQISCNVYSTVKQFHIDGSKYISARIYGTYVLFLILLRFKSDSIILAL